MSVEFEETNTNESTIQAYRSREVFGQPIRPALVTFLINKGIVKTERQSYNLLLIITLASLLIAVVLFGYFVLGIGTPAETRFEIPAEVTEQLNRIRL